MDVEGTSDLDDDEEDTDIEIFGLANGRNDDVAGADDETKRLMKKYNVKASELDTSMELPMLPSISSSAQANAEFANSKGKNSSKQRQRLVQVDTDVYATKLNFLAKRVYLSILKKDGAQPMIDAPAELIPLAAELYALKECGYDLTDATANLWQAAVNLCTQLAVCPSSEVQVRFFQQLQKHCEETEGDYT
jgi:hypothetical protein